MVEWSQSLSYSRNAVVEWEMQAEKNNHTALWEKQTYEIYNTEHPLIDRK